MTIEIRHNPSTESFDTKETKADYSYTLSLKGYFVTPGISVDDSFLTVYTIDTERLDEVRPYIPYYIYEEVNRFLSEQKLKVRSDKIKKILK